MEYEWIEADCPKCLASGVSTKETQINCELCEGKGRLMARVKADDVVGLGFEIIKKRWNEFGEKLRGDDENGEN